MNKYILEVNNLKHYYRPNRNCIVKAVDDVSFNIKQGEIFGLIGESGSGKSTVGRSLLMLKKIEHGEIIFDGKTISNPAVYRKEKSSIRKDIQIIFQNTTSSLNPRMTAIDIVEEPMLIHKVPRQERHKRAIELLKMTGLEESCFTRYPFELSGGQRQRVGIARALTLNPKFIIADEPIASLDVSVQAQIINLFKRLQEQKNISILFIAHDLSMVRHICDRIAVMQHGKLVEMGDTELLCKSAMHPYTRALFDAIPIPDPNYVEPIVRQPKETLEVKANWTWREPEPGHFVLMNV